MHERKLGDRGTGRAEGRAAWLEHREDTLESESRSSGTKLAPPPQQEGLHLNSIPRVISSPLPDGLNPAPRRVLGYRQLAFSEASWLSRQPHPDCLAPELSRSFLKTGLFWNMHPKGAVMAAWPVYTYNEVVGESRPLLADAEEFSFPSKIHGHCVIFLYLPSNLGLCLCLKSNGSR